MYPAIEYRDGIPDAGMFIELYRTTGWDKEGKKSEELLHGALRNSWYVVAAYAAGRLVGCGRIVSDGHMHAYVNEMIVLPAFQGRGIGKEILGRLTAKALGAGITDIQLFAAEGKKEFYLKNGFEERPAGAPGMQYREK